MAPEQVEGREADVGSDLWAVGAVLYEMATGQRPFDGASAANVISAILKDAPVAVSKRTPVFPAALDHVIERCLDQDPEERWQDAGDVCGELKWIVRRASQTDPQLAAAASEASSSSRASVWRTLALVTDPELAAGGANAVSWQTCYPDALFTWLSPLAVRLARTRS